MASSMADGCTSLGRRMPIVTNAQPTNARAQGRSGEATSCVWRSLRSTASPNSASAKNR